MYNYIVFTFEWCETREHANQRGRRKGKCWSLSGFPFYHLGSETESHTICSLHEWIKGLIHKSVTTPPVSNLIHPIHQKNPVPLCLNLLLPFPVCLIPSSPSAQWSLSATAMAAAVTASVSLPSSNSSPLLHRSSLASSSSICTDRICFKKVTWSSSHPTAAVFQVIQQQLCFRLCNTVCWSCMETNSVWGVS